MNNAIYIYQNDFISLLKLVIFLVQHQITPGDMKDETYEPNLFDEIHNLQLENEEDEIEHILQKVPAGIFSRMYYVFLSNNPKKELILYYFFLNFRKYGNQVLYRRDLKCVHEVLKTSKMVSREAHRLKGFLRFQETKEHFLYATIAPDNNVLFLLSKHFQKRLPNEYWLIRDVKRGIMSVFDKKNISIYSEKELKLFQIQTSKEELEMQDLWKMFYQTIGIKKRKNERCRMNFMPKKYWKYIIEMSDE